MSSCYRYIDAIERRRLWSLLLAQAAPLLFTWYFIDHVTPEDECGHILKHNYSFVSPYIIVPDICTWNTTIWFRLNRFLTFSILASSVFVQMYYEVSIRYLGFVFFTTVGLLHNMYRVEKQDNIYYRDAPLLLMLLANVLCLEIRQFNDENLRHQQYLIRLKNQEQRMLREAAERRCWAVVIDKIRNSDDDSAIRSIIREADQEVASYEHLYPLESLPMSPSTGGYLTETQTLVVSMIVYVLYFGLFIISAWSYLYWICRLFFQLLRMI